MDSKFLERIRRPNFPVARRGYERREVDNFMLALAEWLEQGGQEEAGSYAVTRRLERAGETTARVLAAAQAEADEITKEADDAAHEKLKATEDAARQRTEAAHARAQTIVEEAERRRAATESAIRELEARRTATLDAIRRLRDVLGEAIAKQGAARATLLQTPTAPPPAPAIAERPRARELVAAEHVAAPAGGDS